MKSLRYVVSVKYQDVKTATWFNNTESATYCARLETLLLIVKLTQEDITLLNSKS